MSEIKVLAFDTFGTVVDWHGSIIAEMARIAPHVDADRFVRAWRAGYFRTTAECVENGQWRVVDDLHREILDEIAPSFQLGLNEAALDDLNLVWHRLDPWPDSIPGLVRLREKFTITPLSNGGIALLTNMAKLAGIPWDLILSAEVFHAYKPDPRAYLGTAEVMRVRPDQVMMVAAHHRDLDAAKAAGLRTAYIERPLENGAEHPKDVSASPEHPLHFTDIGALADYLGC
ncbi:MAG: haloacid dehalogenase type II [Cumulibacter sp.]